MTSVMTSLGTGRRIMKKNFENRMVGWLAQLAERRSLAGELTLFYPRPVADG